MNLRQKRIKVTDLDILIPYQDATNRSTITKLVPYGFQVPILCIICIIKMNRFRVF